MVSLMKLYWLEIIATNRKVRDNPNFEIDKSVLLAEPINSMGQELIKTKCDSSDNHALYYLSQNLYLPLLRIWIMF